MRRLHEIERVADRRERVAQLVGQRGEELVLATVGEAQRFLRLDALEHLALQRLVAGNEGARARFHFLQHAVERLGEHADLVLGGARDTRRVVAPIHDRARRVGHRADRPREDALQPRGDRCRRGERGEHHERHDAQIGEQALAQAVAGANVDRSQRIACVDDGMVHAQPVPRDMVARGLRLPWNPRLRVAAVSGKQLAVAAVKRSGYDVGPGLKHGEIALGFGAATRGQRRSARPTQDLGLRADIGQPRPAVIVDVVVQQRRGIREQRRQRRCEHHREHLAAHGAAQKRGQHPELLQGPLRRAVRDEQFATSSSLSAPGSTGLVRW